MFEFVAKAPPHSWKVVKNSKIQRWFWFLKIPEDAVFDVIVCCRKGSSVCAVAQIIGGGFSAGEGKLKVTPGWKRSAWCLLPFSISAKNYRPSTVPLERKWELPDWRRAESFWQTRTLIPPSLPINLLYPGLNMSRVDVMLRLCRGQTEYGGGLLRLSALVSATQGTWGEETGRGVL